MSIKKICSCLVIIGLVLTVAQAASARKRPTPPAIDEVQTTWIGVSSGRDYYIRLTLGANGDGKGSYLFLTDSPKAFSFRWSYSAGKIHIFPKEQNAESWLRPLEGTATAGWMDLEAKGKDWKILFYLKKEAELEQTLRDLRRAMEFPLNGEP